MSNLRLAFLVPVLVAACGGSPATAPADPSGSSAPAAPTAAPPPAAPSEAPSDAPAGPDPAALAAAEQTALAQARPVLDKYCAKCHKTGGGRGAKKSTLEHFSMDAYPFGGHHAAEMGHEIREVLGVEGDGDKATMPMDRPGAVQGAELDAVVAWTRAYDASRAASPTP